MGRQKSQPRSHNRQGPQTQSHHPGTLYIIGVPIGSPDDLTIRAGKILKQVSVVAAETPLATQALFEHHGITATITSYGPGHYEEKIAILLDRLNQGQDVALVSDSGMPVIHDPGRLLIEAVHRAGVPISVVPGPSALTAAVALSGYSGDRIVFHGHLPSSHRLLDLFFSKLKGETATTVMFASPRSLRSILKSLARVLPHRTLTLAVNMTRAGEKTYQGYGRTLLHQIRSIQSESEVTVVLAGVEKQEIRKKLKRSKKI
jgi:16S rRNA (cytidine1402-2'-O)-methyltransferase